VYYRASAIDGRLKNPQQYITDDIVKFCSGAAHIYSHLSKPTLDVILSVARTSTSIVPLPCQHHTIFGACDSTFWTIALWIL
jgi:ABC-type uncharacterized transport system fused permease/ATPase subunit